MACFDLTDFAWSAIAKLRPGKVRSVPRADDRCGAERDIPAAAGGRATGRYSDTFWPAYDLRKPLQPMPQGEGPGANIGSCIKGL